MIIGEIKGNVWATKKEDALNSLKLMVVQRIDFVGGDASYHESFVAVDCVGAGIGERVLVTVGSAARYALPNADVPIDAAIVGILDESQWEKRD